LIEPAAVEKVIEGMVNIGITLVYVAIVLVGIVHLVGGSSLFAV